MDVMVLLIFASISVAALFLLLFIFSVRSGQFRDLHTPAVRILVENDQLTLLKKKNPQKEAQRIDGEIPLR